MVFGVGAMVARWRGVVGDDDAGDDLEMVREWVGSGVLVVRLRNE